MADTIQVLAPEAAQNAARAFPTGWGQSDTRAPVLSDGKANPSPDAGKPYATITGAEIAAMVRTPHAPVAKERAQWFIPSHYAAHDARSHTAQRERGAFSWLALDVDQNNLALAEVKEALADVLGGCSLLIYSTASATADNRKWRALVPLKGDLPGADYADTAEAFFDLLETATAGVLICDRALQRPGQLIYLPNPRSGFYESEIVKAAPLDLHPAHPVILRRQDNRAKREAAMAEAAARQAKRRMEALQRGGTDESPIAAFNAAHAVADLLDRYGYRRAGHSNDWRSPLQTSGSYATRDFGDYWISLSESDAAADLGQPSANGTRFGDAFDLFRHFEHGGDFTKAVAAYGAEIRHAQPFTGGDDRRDYSARHLPPPEGNTAPVTPPQADDAGEYFTAADLDGKPVPPREWHVADLIPCYTVTTLGGDGGTGKSLLATQLAVATALGRRWIGQDTKAGPVLFISAEDDRDELHRRLADIARAEGVSLGAMPDLVLRSLAGKDAVFAAATGPGKLLAETPLFRRVAGWIAEHRPRLVVFDTLADLFGGEENNRVHARQFIGLLRGLCQRYRTTVVLLYHPSVSGMNSGSGSSGSTGWNNSVRSRLYFRRVVADDGAKGIEQDTDARELEVMKANYGRKGATFPLRWQEGVFVLDAPASETGLDRMAASAKAERVFLKLLRQFTTEGRRVNHRGGKTYAPAAFAAHPGAEGCARRALTLAMDTLLASRRVRIAEEGPPSRRVQYLTIGGDE